MTIQDLRPMPPLSAGRELPEHATPSKLGHIPLEASNPSWNRGAESVGRALGSAVSSVRRQARNVISLAQDKSADAGQKAEEITEQLRDTGAEMKASAESQLEQVRDRAESYVRSHPLHVIASAAMVGMSVGIGMRIWRSHVH